MSDLKLCLFVVLLLAYVSVDARWLPGGKRDRESFYTPSTILTGDTLALKWTPSLDVDLFDSLPIINCDKKIVVYQITDMRSEVHFLGTNVEADSTKVLYVKDLALWYKQNLNNSIRSECGDGDNKTVFYVNGKITNFEIIETNYYVCKMTMQVSVLGANFKPIWKGEITTENVDWGTSFNQFNYNQVLSNSINCLAANLLNLKLE